MLPGGFQNGFFVCITCDDNVNDTPLEESGDGCGTGEGWDIGDGRDIIFSFTDLTRLSIASFSNGCFKPNSSPSD